MVLVRDGFSGRHKRRKRARIPKGIAIRNQEKMERLLCFAKIIQRIPLRALQRRRVAKFMSRWNPLSTVGLKGLQGRAGQQIILPYQLDPYHRLHSGSS